MISFNKKQVFWCFLCNLWYFFCILECFFSNSWFCYCKVWICSFNVFTWWLSFTCSSTSSFGLIRTYLFPFSFKLCSSSMISFL
jgi:hypothetical protein